MRVLLVSTYELGHQPVHLASPAARLLEAGHDVRAVDLAVDSLDRDMLGWAEALAVSVPMHTAMRLAVDVLRGVRRERPDLPVAVYGLYAAVSADRTVGELADVALVGEYEPELVAWVSEVERGSTGGPAVRVDISQGRFLPPARHLLPPLERYARLEVDGEQRLAGYVEASHGCRHRCRHCPIPAVYDGRFRIVDVDTTMADISQLVEMGAHHVTLGDPDFLNGPAHALRVLEAAHEAFPGLTFDVTIKVEHLLRHADLLPRLAQANVLFVVSAFESVEDHVLEFLDKGHTVADMAAAVQVAREAGLDLHPSWMPFTPWTEPSGVLGMFEFLHAHDLVPVTDPVQASIRMLVPDGSLTLEIPEMRPHLRGYDPEALGHRWESQIPETDAAQRALESIASVDADGGRSSTDTLRTMWVEAARRLGGDPGAVPHLVPSPGRPRLTEAWFCCAEPTAGQLGSVQIGASSPARFDRAERPLAARPRVG